MYELSKRWLLKGAEVEVITAPYAKSDVKASRFIESQILQGINLTVINSGDDNRLSTINRAFNSIVFSVTAAFLVLFKKYDILLASSGPITVGIPMLIAKLIRRKKTVFEVRDLWPEGAIQMKKINNYILIRFARYFEKICYSSANAIVAASPGMRDGIVEVLNKDWKVFVFPNASDIELFRIPPTKPRTFYNALDGKSIIIYAGSLGEMDECETAVKAMGHFRDQDLALVFIGDGVEKASLQDLANQTNDNIYFTGLVEKTEVVKWYSIAAASLVGFKDYSVLSTSSPNKMFDSFAAGVPVIQNTNGWIKELIDEYGGGFNVKYQSIDSYVQVFTTVLNDKTVLKTHRQRASYLAHTMFNREDIARDYFLMLKSLLEEKPKIYF